MDDIARRVGQKVLKFYKEMPFNYYATVEDQVESVRSTNYLAEHPSLQPLLTRGTKVLEVGCGTGGIACSIAHYYGCEVTAIDFNSKAIERAAAVRDQLGLAVSFSVQDLFTYQPETRFDLVISSGVLHCTHDCMGALRRLCRVFTREGGYLYIGLYHTYGREAFSEFVENMKRSGLSEDKMFSKYVAIQTRKQDPLLLMSWFRDQVLHPHESHHTLEEVCTNMQKENCNLISTSINDFSTFDDVEQLFELEKSYEELARQKLRQNEYYSGFFRVLAQKAGS
jgi:ubiquinone/menaquinone biosynthesis C-methylase UbiE